MRNVLNVARRPWRPHVDVAFVALVLLLWQAARIPLEGARAVSMAHAGSWLRAEDVLHLDVEDHVVALVDRLSLSGPLDWLYGNMHLPMLFGFMAAARLLAPRRYPLLRTTYVLSFLPALAVIGLYPLAPPHWLPEFGGTAPSDEQLTGTLQVLLENSTAAAASQHFGFAIMIAAASLWLWPRSPIAAATLAYPALVFLIIVGTSQHYVLDCVVGTLTFVAALLAAHRIHDSPNEARADVPPWTLLVAAAGYALCAWSVEAVHDDPHFVTVALPGLLGVLAALAGPKLGPAIKRVREEGWQTLEPSQEEAGA